MFSMMAKDTINIIKNNGDKFENIKSTVTPSEIIIKSDILIETGDLIQRKMSNGGFETYQVIDPCFYEAHFSIPAHYQIKYKKLGIPEAKQAIQQITYNITGNNARINQNSVDNSTNTINNNEQISSFINELRKEIKGLSLDIQKEQDALEIVSSIEQQYSTGSISKPVFSALLGALPAVQSITTIANNIRLLLGM